MCPRQRTIFGDLTYDEQMLGDSPEEDDSPEPLESGLADSNGPTGEPLPSEGSGVRMVRRHHGLSTISVSSLILTERVPGTFVALKGVGLGEYTVTLSLGLTSTQYAALIATLEQQPGTPGGNVSVGVKFEPTTQNLVPQDTAPST